MGPFAFLSCHTPASDVEAIYERAAGGRAFFELPHIAAAWHPRLTDEGGACVAETAEGPWVARPRSEEISLVDTIGAKDSLGGMLNALVPLLAVRGWQPKGAELLAASLRLIAAALKEHPRNQEEMVRSEGMLLLGHLLRSVAPAHFSDAAVDALVGLSESCRRVEALHSQLVACVLLRFDIWRRLHSDVRSSHLALLQGLAAQDTRQALASGLPQRLLDAARNDAAATSSSTVATAAASAPSSSSSSSTVSASASALAGVTDGIGAGVSVGVGVGAAAGERPRVAAASDSTTASLLHEQHLNAASMQVHVYLSIYPSIHRSVHPSIHLSIYLSTGLSVFLSVYRSIDLSFHPSTYPSIYLSTCLSI